MFNKSKFQGAYTTPIGQVMAFSPGHDPNYQTGNNQVWIKCDGKIVAKVDYPELYEVINEIYGEIYDENNTFVLPDYRGKMIVGVGRIDGNDDNSLYIGNNSNVSVGMLGGSFVVDHDIFRNSTYIQVGDVTTTGWENVQSQVQTIIDGTWNLQFGPLDDVILNGVPNHSHNILTSEVNEQRGVSGVFSTMDPFAVCYDNVSAFMESFTPNGLSVGVPYGHSHGLVKGTSRIDFSTFGNESGVSIRDADDLSKYKTTTLSRATVSSFRYINGIVELTFDTEHGYEVGNTIFVSGFDQDEFNGRFVVAESTFTSTRLAYEVLLLSTISNPTSRERVIVQRLSSIVTTEIDTIVSTDVRTRTIISEFRNVFHFRNNSNPDSIRYGIVTDGSSFGSHPVTGRFPDNGSVLDLAELRGESVIETDAEKEQSPYINFQTRPPISIDGVIVENYLKINGNSIRIGPFRGIRSFDVIFALGTSGDDPGDIYFYSHPNGDDIHVVNGESPFLRNLQHREELYVRVYERDIGTEDWGNPINGDNGQDIFTLGPEFDYDLQNTENNPDFVIAAPLSEDHIALVRNAVETTPNPWRGTIPGASSNKEYLLEFGRDGAPGPDVYGIFAISVGYVEEITQTFDVVVERLTEIEREIVSTRLAGQVDNISSNLNNLNLDNGPDIVRYSYTPENLNLSLSTGLVTMTRFNNFNLIPSLHTDGERGLILNKYRNVNYWIKAR